jgi:hypothetical protein
MRPAALLLYCTLSFALAGNVFPARAEESTKLELRNLQPVYDQLGPVRKDLTYVPGERVRVQYDLYGCALDQAGDTDIEISCRLIDAAGKVRNAFSYPYKGDNWQTSDAFLRESTYYALPDSLRPGKYTLEIGAEDHLSQQEASVQQAITVKPLQLTMVSPRFYYDEKRTSPAPLGGLINQSLYIDCDVVGEDRSHGKIALACSLDVLDGDGVSVLKAPHKFDFLLEGEKVPQERSQHFTYNGYLYLRQAGAYTMRIQAVDKVTGEVARLDLPLEVRDNLK